MAEFILAPCVEDVRFDMRVAAFFSKLYLESHCCIAVPQPEPAPKIDQHLCRLPGQRVLPNAGPG